MTFHQQKQCERVYDKQSNLLHRSYLNILYLSISQVSLVLFQTSLAVWHHGCFEVACQGVGAVLLGIGKRRHNGREKGVRNSAKIRKRSSFILKLNKEEKLESAQEIKIRLMICTSRRKHFNLFI